MGIIGQIGRIRQIRLMGYCTNLINRLKITEVMTLSKGLDARKPEGGRGASRRDVNARPAFFVKVHIVRLIDRLVYEPNTYRQGLANGRAGNSGSTGSISGSQEVWGGLECSPRVFFPSVAPPGVVAMEGRP